MESRFTYKKVWMDALQALPAQARGEVNDAITAYGLSEEETNLEGAAKAVFILIKAEMDRDKNRREKSRQAAIRRREKTAANGKNKEQETENEKEKVPHTPYKEKDKEKEEEPLSPHTHAHENESDETRHAVKRKRFTPPTVEEVAQYCKERNNGIDPGCFVDFYTANGWVQNRGKSIKNWKAAVRTWERRQKADSAYGAAKGATAVNGRQYVSRDEIRETERQRRLEGYAAVIDEWMNTPAQTNANDWRGLVGRAADPDMTPY